MTQTKTADRCGDCGSPLDGDFRHCSACRSARAGRYRSWYAEHGSDEGAKKAMRVKVRDRFEPDMLTLMLDHLRASQQGKCRMCGEARPLTLHWSIEDTLEDKTPMLHGAVCRSCKIHYTRWCKPMATRVQHASIRLMAQRYHMRALLDPYAVVTAAGGVVKKVGPVVTVAPAGGDTELWDWVASLRASARATAPQPEG